MGCKDAFHGCAYFCKLSGIVFAEKRFCDADAHRVEIFGSKAPGCGSGAAHADATGDKRRKRLVGNGVLVDGYADGLK